LKTKGNKAAVCIACVAVLGLGASSAHAQSGGTGTPTVSPSTGPTYSGPTYTVVKKATWYGPGLWGNQTACGMVLQPTVIGTAHKGLPCGTPVTFSFAGRTVSATVIDRGPFRKGYAWDLTKKAAKRVGFLAKGSGKITATVGG
jgi:rare lipoprotein A (peptidoglycan hydrolase)